MLKKACPHCKEKRLLEGPAYDRDDIRCLNCGRKFRRKKK